MAPPPPTEGDDLAALTALHHEVATIAESFGAELPESLHEELESLEQQVQPPLSLPLSPNPCLSMRFTLSQRTVPSAAANRWSTCWSSRKSSKRRAIETQTQRKKQWGSLILPP
jgi:hypothetical protein